MAYGMHAVGVPSGAPSQAIGRPSSMTLSCSGCVGPTVVVLALKSVSPCNPWPRGGQSPSLSKFDSQTSTNVTYLGDIRRNSGGKTRQGPAYCLV